MLVAGRLWVAGFGSPALGQRSGMSFAVAVDSGRGDRVSEGDTDLDALLAGDKAAWDRFVARHAGVIFAAVRRRLVPAGRSADAEDVRSEEHTSELQSLMRISYAVFCLKQKKIHNTLTDVCYWT